MLNRLLITVRRIDSAGDIPNPVISAAGAAMKTTVKYASNCKPLYATHPLSLVGQSSDRY
jgi:hypothetical protein